MMWFVVALGLMVGVAGSGLFSGSETGLYCLNRLRLHLAVQQEDRRAVRLARWLENEQRALAVALAGTNVTDYIGTVAVAYMFTRLLGFSEADTELYTILLVTPLVFVFGEVVPKNLFQRHADSLMPRVSLLLRWSEVFFRVIGVVSLLTALTGAANRLFVGESSTRAADSSKRRVALLLQEALAGQVHGEHQSSLIDGVVRLSETSVRAVMVPFHRVVSVAREIDRRELARMARIAPYTRFLVHVGRRSRVIGAVKVDDVLRSAALTVADVARPVAKLSANTSVAAAIAELRQAGSELAVVANHAGHMLGLVTLRDLLEEVVGELGDHD
jgi:CBS domain containing-hemolysin-like protein